jgi:hypothetical protein
VAGSLSARVLGKRGIGPPIGSGASVGVAYVTGIYMYAVAFFLLAARAGTGRGAFVLCLAVLGRDVWTKRARISCCVLLCHYVPLSGAGAGVDGRCRCGGLADGTFIHSEGTYKLLFMLVRFIHCLRCMDLDKECLMWQLADDQHLRGYLNATITPCP